jgi:N utilization substance protein B
VARRLAFLTLFELESRPGSAVTEALERRLEMLEEDTGERLDAPSVKFARALVEGTLALRSEIDAQIHEDAPAFPVDQIAVTDRVAMELGVFELLHRGDSPIGVVINEAVEVAKTYGGDGSGRFVNGVLGTIAEELTEDARPLSGPNRARPQHPSH